MNTNYSDLNLKTIIKEESFTFNDKEIIVYDYLPFEDKYDLLMITLQKADENGLYNPLKLDMFFHLHLVYMYTNIEFTEEDRQDEFKLYNELYSSGLLNMILGHMNAAEYEYLQSALEEYLATSYKYRNSAAALLQSVINDLPRNAATAAKIVEEFDPEKYQAVIDFATAANGNRPVPLK